MGICIKKRLNLRASKSINCDKNKKSFFKTLIFFSFLILVTTQSTESESTKKTQAVFLKQSKLSKIDKKILRMGLKKTNQIFDSKASWYGEYFHGRTTANMEIYNKDQITAAHKTLAINTYVLITNKLNNKKLIVRINDRGPYVEGRDIDLSEAAAKILGSHKKGVVPISYQILQKA